MDLNLGEKPTLPPLVEAQVENHIMGVVFAQQYTLKKGPKKLAIELRKLPPKNSSRSMIWVHVNLWMTPNSQKEEQMEALSSLLFIAEKKKMVKLKAENVL